MSEQVPDAVPSGDELAAAGAVPAVVDVQSLEEQIAELQAKRDALAAAAPAPAPEPPAEPSLADHIPAIADNAVREALAYIASKLHI